MSTTTTTLHPPPARNLPHTPRSLTRSRKSGIGGVATASTPNLNALYSAHSTRLHPGALGRKASHAALTPGTLAAIPDDSESYAFDSVLNDTPAPLRKMMPQTPGKPAGGEDHAVGDVVDVPGGGFGYVRFVGTVEGRKGTFAGVELHQDFASRGKNNGEVDGVSYFTPNTPGAGIFVPVNKLLKRDSPSGVAPRSPSLASSSLAALRVASQNTTNYTPATPSLPKFSQSVGPGRAPSPTNRRARTSLPRPDSPVRRLNPTTQPSIATPAPKGPPRYGSPSISKFSASVRGTAGDPSKAPSRLERKPSLQPRSASALGTASQHSDDETTPVGNRLKTTNGSIGSIASLKMRPASRAAAADEEEIQRLRSQLEERDRQLKDQASALAEMESSVTELTSLMANPDMGLPSLGVGDDKDSGQLRAMLREKNDKIALLTTEFDTHRADFRSTIDTLEMASTETQRVYDARIKELEQEIHDVQNNNEDVDSVARQLKGLEELVQELEEGLEDARRGEAEARGEVEFLRGEVERTRSELRREREKAAAQTSGGSGDVSSLSKELEKKEDEIRGLKAIIHSLSRDSLPQSETSDKPAMQRNQSFGSSRPESLDTRMAREKMEREVNELRSLIEAKNTREEELEKEVEALRRGNATNRGSQMTVRSNDRSSYRDSKGTVILARNSQSPKHKRVGTLDTIAAESDAYSSVTESSTLWCEICETGGHDILTCTNMFGPEKDKKADTAQPPKTGKDVVREALKPLAVPSPDDNFVPRPLTPVKTPQAAQPPPAAKISILPNPTDSGPLAGKDSGVIDPEKWCALCERDGHDSIDCPLEDAF